MSLIEKFKKYTEISDITEAALNHASQYTEIAEEHQKIFLLALQLKSKQSQVEAEVDEHIRNFFNSGLTEGAPDAKTKTKLTEAQVKAKIQADPKVKQATEEANKAESELVLVNHLLDAMKQRSKMIASLLNVMEE
jgi:hypothetical protein